MLFNSFAFLIFFPLVCLVYFLLPTKNLRNIFLLIASYYFYMNWKPVYAVLILSSTLITYFCGILVENNNGNRKRQRLFLVLSLVINFSILFIFKYFNFINESVFAALNYTGLRWEVPNLNVLLPVGISFYTFQAVGYSIDVYRGDLKAERKLSVYALFVSFFPQLVAGPIERAKNLLPQFHKKQIFNYDAVVEGAKLMLWGYFIKLCVADRLGLYVDAVYNNVGQHNGTSLLVATFFFAFQIYGDFAGYSLIAIGAAKIMGYKLMENFRRPYFSTSVGEFWKRWHISLSTWFKDYLYIPLGGNRVNAWRHLLNLLITFVISGMWHGANWTFLAWGSLHGLYLIIGVLKTKYLPALKLPRRIGKLWNILIVFILTNFAWVFFRANSIDNAFEIIHKVFTEQGALFIDASVFAVGLLSLFILLLKDLKDEFQLRLNLLHSTNVVVRYVSAIVLIAFIVSMGVLDGGQFIYFQF